MHEDVAEKQEQLLSKNLKGTWEEHVSETIVFDTSFCLQLNSSAQVAIKVVQTTLAGPEPS